MIGEVLVTTKLLPALIHIDSLLKGHGSAASALKAERTELRRNAEGEATSEGEVVPPWAVAHDDDKISILVRELKMTKAGQGVIAKQVSPMHEILVELDPPSSCTNTSQSSRWLVGFHQEVEIRQGHPRGRHARFCSERCTLGDGSTSP